MKVGVLILGAGRGVRMGQGLPKAFLSLRGRPLFLYSLEAFRGIGERVLVVPPGWEREAEEITKGAALVVLGGSTRQESSLRGLEALKEADYVLIHDAARPLVGKGLIKRVLQEAPKAAIPVLEPTEALVETEGGQVVRTLDRKRVRHVQTPQGFPYGEILQAHMEAPSRGISDAPDDATLYIMAGGQVVTVEGDRRNIKVTFPEDLKLAEDLLR